MNIQDEIEPRQRKIAYNISRPVPSALTLN